MPVVRINNLAQLKAQWDSIIARHRQPAPVPGQQHQHLPNTRFIQSSTEFQQLVDDLAKYPRIEWFFYTDNSDGIALRLYDRSFRDSYPQHFRERAASSGEEWVILRGKDLGDPAGPCKQQMRAAFGTGSIWPPGQPPNPRGVTLNAETANRLDFFEDQYHNNAGGQVVEDDEPEEEEIASPQGEPTLTDLLRQFGQVIFYGPPGTGKTREAKRAALAMLQPNPMGTAIPCPICNAPIQLPTDNEGEVVRCPVQSCRGSVARDRLVEKALATLRKERRFDLVVFHPSYEYEQFVGGIEPKVVGSQIGFQIKEGIFLQLCRKAEEVPDQSVVLVVDEINRGNLPKLLGELLYALEYRGDAVTLPFVCPDGRTELVIPKNLYIIATMNSSDRSIGHIDVAIRRRFGLCHIGPNPDVVRTAWQQIVGAETYGRTLADLMVKLNKSLGGEDLTAEVELGVGHSYFLPNPGSSRDDALRQVRMKWVNQVQPLLREYGQLLNLGADFFQRFRDLPAPPA